MLENEEVGNIKIISLIILLVLCIPWAGCDRQEKSTGTDYGLINPQRDFTLHDQDGKTFHLKDHRGEMVLLFFGYTSCPDVCPTTLSKLARVYKLLGPIRQNVLTVFVTIDPARDTPLKLKEYLQYFNINALGLTGTKQEIDRVVDSYKATYEKVETNSSALGYMFDHTDYLYLIDRQGKTSYLFHPDDKALDMAKIIKERFDHG
jgi:protein SCO1/2